MMGTGILALDQGTTSSRAMIFDHAGRILATAQSEFEQFFPQPSWVEHDADEIWSTQISVAVQALSKAHLRPRDIAAVGITNQRETTIVWDRETGQPIHRAIVWQDRRTADQCAKLRAGGHAEFVQQRTGLLIDPYFSATKIAWILEHVAGARAKAESGKLAFGTVDSWLAWKLTSGKLHITDATNASRTMLFNIHSGEWDEELLRLFQIPRSMLPEVRGSSDIYGPVSTSLLGTGEIPLAGMAGDQQAALFGQLCFSPGETKTTYGTGCFMLQQTGTTARASKNRLVTTVASRIEGEDCYALEGSVFIGGAVVQWLRDGLGIIRESSDIRALASSVPDNGGVYLVPAFTGLGAPHWDSQARGAIVGLTRGSTKAHIARAAVESIAFQVADLFDAMCKDAELQVPEMRVDGGASRDDLLMQFQADLLGIPLVRPAQTETTAAGAAYLAGLAAGFWKSREELAALQTGGTRFEPKRKREEVKRLRSQWSRALERAEGWEQEQA